MSVQCPFCGEEFNSLDSMPSHSRIHDESWFGSCGRCGTIFVSEEKYSQHYVEEHDHIECPNSGCLTTEQDGYALEHHYRQKHGGHLREDHPEIDTSHNWSWMKGRSWSDEMKEKISVAVKNSEYPDNWVENRPSFSGEANPMYGKTRSKETKKKISESRKGWTPSEEFVENISKRNSGEGNPMYGKYGEEHPAYTGGYDGDWRKSGKWRKIKRSIKKRDKKQCQWCGETEEEIHAHHIIPVSEGGDKYDEDNLISLCKQHHYSAHRKNGEVFFA